MNELIYIYKWVYAHIYEELNRTHLQHFSELTGISIFIIINAGTATSRKNTKWQIYIYHSRDCWHFALITIQKLTKETLWSSSQQFKHEFLKSNILSQHNPEINSFHMYVLRSNGGEVFVFRNPTVKSPRKQTLWVEGHPNWDAQGLKAEPRCLGAMWRDDMHGVCLGAVWRDHMHMVYALVLCEAMACVV